MARSRFRSAIDLGLRLGAPLLASLAAGCSDDDTCGPGNSVDRSVVASRDAVTLTYGEFVSRVGNDCPAAGAPAGVISLTIESAQTDGTGLFTLCVARPDLLAEQSQSLGGDVAGVEVRIIDFTGTASGCAFRIDRTQPVTGTATSTGLCSNGNDSRGFALSVDGTVTLSRTCGTTVDAVTVMLRGRVAVTAVGR